MALSRPPDAGPPEARPGAHPEALVIDALDRPHPAASIGPDWALVSDRVMGGVSTGVLRRETVAGRPALRLAGSVSLENDGGFLQMALDLAPGGGVLDASGWTGLAIEVLGRGETYGAHLRTADLARPWQSFRAAFVAPPAWTVARLPFAAFAPHRTEAPLDLGRLRRLGLVAIGRAFEADLAVARVALYR